MVLAAFAFAAGSAEVVETETADAGHGETEIVVYSTIFAEYAEAMKAGFEAIHSGVTVHVLNPGGTEAMFKKLESESGNPQADVVNAIDYLLKPFQDERFYEALSRVQVGETPNTNTLVELRELIEGSVSKKTYLDRITVKDRFEFRVIPAVEIDFFSTEDGLVFLHIGSIKYVIDQTLSQLEKKLDPELFFRAHRKSLLNIKKVDRMVPWGRGRYVLRFSGDEKVHLSKEKTRKFKRLIGLN